MKTIALFCAAAGFAIALSSPAAAFVPGQAQIAKDAAVVSDTIQVKKHWKSGRSSGWHRPPGWDRGRKTGWGRGHVPPGQRGRYIHRW